MPKLQPAVLTLNFTSDGYIDLSQCASIVNRRFYRQGLQWAVSGFTIELDAAVTTGNIRIETLPTTWVCSSAWHKAMAMWLKQQNEDLEESGAESAVARFRDFKIYMDTTHHTDGFTNNLLPRTANGAFAPGEWQPSQIVVPTDTATPLEYNLHMVGANVSAGAGGDPDSLFSRGIIDGYENSRAYPQSPDPVSPALDSGNNWMRAMFDVGQDNPEVIANATARNDDLPYPQTNYPGGDTQAPELQLHSAFSATGSTVIGNRLSVPGCVVPCGLIKFSNDTGVNARLQVHLVPGNHRGYLAEPMQDM